MMHIFEMIALCLECSDCTEWCWWRQTCAWVLQSVWWSSCRFPGETAAVAGATL